MTTATVATEKYCKACDQTKPACAFSKDSTIKDGLKFYCRECTKERNAARKKNYAVSCEGKHCAICQEWKLAADFYKDRTKTDGLHSYCRECQKQTSAVWRAAHPDEVRHHSARWPTGNVDRPDVKIAAAYRRRAVELGVPSVPYTRAELAARWAYYGGMCWMGCGRAATQTDHVKPLSKGGSEMLCNLRPACRSCNASKGAKWPFSVDMSSPHAR